MLLYIIIHLYLYIILYIYKYHNSERRARPNFRSVSRRRNRPQRFSPSRQIWNLLQRQHFSIKLSTIYMKIIYRRLSQCNPERTYCKWIPSRPIWNPFHPQASTLFHHHHAADATRRVLEQERFSIQGRCQNIFPDKLQLRFKFYKSKMHLGLLSCQADWEEYETRFSDICIEFFDYMTCKGTRRNEFAESPVMSSPHMSWGSARAG